MGLPEYDTSIVEFDGCVNLMKGAIETANRVSTVSPTYAQEILDPWFSHGLDPILKERQWKLSGILNGIDVENIIRKRTRISMPITAPMICPARRKTSGLCRSA